MPTAPTTGTRRRKGGHSRPYARVSSTRHGSSACDTFSGVAYVKALCAALDTLTDRLNLSAEVKTFGELKIF